MYESRLVVPWSGRRGYWALSAHGRGVSFQGDEKVLELDSGDGGTTL